MIQQAAHDFDHGVTATDIGPGIYDRARLLYDEQKDTLAMSLDLAVKGRLGLEGAAWIAGLLHKIAGTAAYFNEAALGAVAAGLEPVFRAVPPDANLCAVAALAGRRLRASGLEARATGGRS